MRLYVQCAFQFLPVTQAVISLIKCIREMKLPVLIGIMPTLFLCNYLIATPCPYFTLFSLIVKSQTLISFGQKEFLMENDFDRRYLTHYTYIRV